MKRDVDGFWRNLIPKEFPSGGDLLKRVPVPMFLQNGTHSLGVHSAIGDARLVETVEENSRLVELTAITGVGVILDSDQQVPALQRYHALTAGLDGKGFALPGNPGEISVGPPRFGAYVLPDNHNAGTLEDLLIEYAPCMFTRTFCEARPDTLSLFLAMRPLQLTIDAISTRPLVETRRSWGQLRVFFGRARQFRYRSRTIVGSATRRWLYRASRPFKTSSSLCWS